MKAMIGTISGITARLLIIAMVVLAIQFLQHHDYSHGVGDLFLAGILEWVFGEQQRKTTATTAVMAVQDSAEDITTRIRRG